METIHLIAPSGPFIPEKFEKGVTTLKELGFQVTFRPDIFDRDDYLAGTLERREKEFIDAIQDDRVDIIMAARGGFGLSHLMPKLWKLPQPKKPKTLVGFSDFTLALLCAEKWGWNAIHSPMMANDAFLNKSTEELKNWVACVRGQPRVYKFDLLFKTQDTGTFEGVLRGGCLSILAHTLGSPWAFTPTDPTVLFLEDVNEAAYQIDRYWSHLESAVDLTPIKAVVWGEMDICPEFLVALKKIADRTRCPHFFGLPIGHGPHSQEIKFFNKVRLQIKGSTADLEYL